MFVTVIIVGGRRYLGVERCRPVTIRIQKKRNKEQAWKSQNISNYIYKVKGKREFSNSSDSKEWKIRYLKTHANEFADNAMPSSIILNKQIQWGNKRILIKECPYLNQFTVQNFKIIFNFKINARTQTGNRMLK